MNEKNLKSQSEATVQQCNPFGFLHVSNVKIYEIPYKE